MTAPDRAVVVAEALAAIEWLHAAHTEQSGKIACPMCLLDHPCPTILEVRKIATALDTLPAQGLSEAVDAALAEVVDRVAADSSVTHAVHVCRLIGAMRREREAVMTEADEVHEACEIANAVGRIYEVCDRCKRIMWPVVAGPRTPATQVQAARTSGHPEGRCLSVQCGRCYPMQGSTT